MLIESTLDGLFSEITFGQPSFCEAKKDLFLPWHRGISKQKSSIKKDNWWAVEKLIDEYQIYMPILQFTATNFIKKNRIHHYNSHSIFLIYMKYIVSYSWKPSMLWKGLL